MNVNVRLFGTLRRSVEAYNHSCGINATMPEGADIHDLLVHLDLLDESIGMVFMDNTLVKETTKLNHNAGIKIFQPIFGG